MTGDERAQDRATTAPGSGRRSRTHVFVTSLLVVVAAFAGVAAAAPATAPGSEPRAAVGHLVAVGEAAAAPLTLSGWSIGGDEDRTVVTFDLSRRAPLRVFTLAAPARVVIDLPGGRIDGETAGRHDGRGLVVNWRFGAFAAGRSRLVLETRGAVKPVRAVYDPTAAADRPRFLLELVPASREDMARTAPVDVATVATGGPPGLASDRDTVTSAIAASADHRPTIVVDAGHGGIDAGTVSPATGTPEKSVVLEMARTLAHRLTESGRYRVFLTRDDDVFLGLGERVTFARAHHADLFLSIHADAEYDHSVRGATIYTLAEKASDEQAAALAAKENQSDALAGHVVEEADADVADILADLTLRETRRLSHGFARDLLDEYRRHGRLVKTQPHRQAGLRVLRAHDIPSVLVEIGFLSNKEDEALMTSTSWRERTAESLVSAIDRWFSSRNALAEPTKDGGGRAAASP